MCERCIEIDAKIGRFKWLASAVDDERTANGIQQLIQQNEAEKHALHPERE
jgi:hypothetical protein